MHSVLVVSRPPRMHISATIYPPHDRAHCGAWVGIEEPRVFYNILEATPGAPELTCTRCLKYFEERRDYFLTYFARMYG